MFFIPCSSQFWVVGCTLQLTQVMYSDGGVMEGTEIFIMDFSHVNVDLCIEVTEAILVVSTCCTNMPGNHPAVVLRCRRMEWT